MSRPDVYAYGVVASSTLYSIHGAFPAAEGYAEIDDIQAMTGGEAANSSIVLSRLGARVMLEGNWLGAHDEGRRTKQLLEQRGVDTSRLTLKQNYRGASETVFAAQGTRTIFGTYGRVLEDAAWNEPRDEDVTAAKVVCLDPFFSKPAARCAQVAFDAGIPVITVDCPFDDPLLKHTAAVVVAESYLRETYPDRDLDEVFSHYVAATPGLVIFTFGASKGWYATAGEAVRKFEPYAVEPVDTTGAGDSFRAGIVFGFLRGWSVENTIDFASAVAAMNCTRFPGVMNSPDLDEVSAFMAGSTAF